ncbi:MAG: hypothetical protein ACI3Y4_06080 [Candidatus Cryptobacteroides sp.]
MKKHLALLLAAFAVLVSCNGHSDLVNPEEIKPEHVDGTVFFAGTMPQYVGEVLYEYLDNTTSNIENAEILVFAPSYASLYKKQIREAWENGKIIVLVKPDPASIGEPDHDLLLIAYHRFSTYRIHDPLNILEHLFDVEVQDDENASESKEKIEEGDSGKSAEIEESAEYYSSKIKYLFSWLNEQLKIRNVQASAPEKTNMEMLTDLSSKIDDLEFSQIESGRLSIGAKDYKLCKVALSKPDVITRNSELSYVVKITPFYAFETPYSKAADYYFVTMTITSHNAPLFGTYKKKHGGVHTYAHAFYGENIAWSARLDTSAVNDNKKYTIEFFEEPRPTTTKNQTSYTSGFSATLNISGQGGIQGGKPALVGTVGGSFTWNNATTVNISDEQVAENSLGSTVNYEYKCVNFNMHDNHEKAVPQIAKSNQICSASWCWKVSGVSDYEDTEFSLKIHTDPLYGYMYRHATWGAEGHIRHDVHLLNENDRDITIKLKRPNRAPTGLIELKNTAENGYVKDVHVVQERTSKPDTTLFESNSSYEQDYLLRYQVPVGKYHLDYILQYKEDKKVVRDTLTISGINVTSGSTSSHDSYEPYQN